jgi:uncharacterized protein (DUF2132 family)
MPHPSASVDPFHGLTLEVMLERLVAHFGWEEMGQAVKIRCFLFNPSIKSSLQFLRRTPWARKKVEELYLCYLEETK